MQSFSFIKILSKVNDSLVLKKIISMNERNLTVNKRTGMEVCLKKEDLSINQDACHMKNR